MAALKKKAALTKIAVIGGGPKAAAIATKAACLNVARGSTLEVSIFERSTIAAHWDGLHGYTDGQQQLCTPAERDLGFPYSSENALDVDALMQREFSWAAYQVDKGVYRHWVNRGRPAPSHGEFADYLRHCVSKTKAPVHLGEVQKIRSVAGKWIVDSSASHGGRMKSRTGFDALVITGHGPQGQRLPHQMHERVFDGVDFWARLAKLEGILSQEPGGAVVIVGGGGTAAAIAGWLTRQRTQNPIIILGDQASFVARVDNWFENQVFTEKDLWKSLGPEAQRKFTERLTRGAVWANVLEEVSRSERLTYRSGRANSIGVKPSAGGDELYVSYSTGDDSSSQMSVGCWVVVDATGFDDMWFMPLLPARLQKKLASKENIQLVMDENLSVRYSGFGPLHLPMMSQLRSPAFVSLMALGEMATDILQPYT